MAILSPPLQENYAALREKIIAYGKPIVLIGMMGSGKSAVGYRLESWLNLKYCDTDKEIEQSARMTISEIFASYGEPEFRALEKRVIQRIVSTPVESESFAWIIATGGGAITNQDTRELFKQRGITIWLNASFDQILSRIALKNNRPLLPNENRRATLERLLTERSAFYHAADIAINTSDTSDETTVMILDQLVLWYETVGAFPS